MKENKNGERDMGKKGMGRRQGNEMNQRYDKGPVPINLLGQWSHEILHE
jgi:hypothetical protein